MSWTPLAERFSSLPLILAGPMLRRTEPRAVTVWLALKTPQVVTLRIYSRNGAGTLFQQLESTRHTVRLGDHLHIVAVTARATNEHERLAWGELYYYNLFFQPDGTPESYESETPASLDTPGILTNEPASADPLRRLVYPGHPLPSFVLPPEDLNRVRYLHGSCRKPHGVGKEMLSVADAMLEEAAKNAIKRPQQLFMTGDQIYGDDVAASLLFTLIDAGKFLLEGNREEVLPLVQVPASRLAPGERSEVVRNKAMFTTTTPQSQLLSFAEYATMYLFAWSDALWPDDLPDAEDIWNAYPEARPQPAFQQREEATYAEHVERLRTFRSTLPQVRRALANIATYMICDDHDVTDDWYLDGAWCHQVLASPLGRGVVRNALLAYALFQAWGNTPQQFAGESGMALLNAVDTWRGNASDARIETIEEIIGLPAAFSGSGELPRSPRALHWYHTYEGPRYQVILMDTRTQRFYRSRHDFPGLLSPDAVHRQVAAAVREDAEVTIIISATPMLGVDFIESIQVWSHWFVKENYPYDCEAWALEWETFQHFMKTVSVMKRVVFLSGDVHYAFGSSMEYWDRHTHASAKLVNYTSSSFHNEGAGSHMAVLAIGYPRLLHLMRRQGTPTLEYFAWDIVPGDRHVLDQVVPLIWQRIYLFWWAIPRLLAARRSPYEIVMPARGWLKGAFRGYPPDRTYRLRYLRNTLSLVRLRKRDRLRLRTSTWTLRLLRIPLGLITLIETGTRRITRTLLLRVRKVEQTSSLPAAPVRTLEQEAAQGTNLLERQLAKPRNKLVAAFLRYAGWAKRSKAGELIVGYNNLGEIHFTWTAERKVVMQRLWYYSDNPAQPLLKTDYYDTLELPAPNDAPPIP